MLRTTCFRLVRAVALVTAFAFSTPLLAAAASPTQEIKLAETAFVRSPTLPAWARLTNTAPANSLHGNAVMQVAETLFYVDTRPTVLAHRIIAINEASALGTAGQREITFQPEYQQVTLHTVRILRQGEVLDKTNSVKVTFQQHDRDNNNTVFTGWVNAVVVVDDLRVGDSLEITYAVSGENPVFKGRLFDNVSWDDMSLLPVALRRVEVNLPEARHLQYRLVGGNGVQVTPQETRADGRRILSFTGHDLPAVDPDTYVPGDSSPLRWLQLSEYASWRELNTWALDLFRIQTLPPAFKPVLAAIDAAPDKEGKILKALDFVQNEIRYVSMSLGENSHRPFLPAEVLARRYGDCKDKSLLLVSLLRQFGIEASPVLLSTQVRRNLDTLLPSPLDFDHAIVRIVHGGKTYFIDPTLQRQFGTLDVLGQAHPAVQVLVVEPGTTGLTSTPPPQEALIANERRERVQIKRVDGPAELELTMHYVGLAAEAYRNARARLSPEHLRKHFASLLDNRYTGAEMLGEPNFADDTKANSVLITVRYRLPRFLETSNNAWLARYQASNLSDLFNVPTAQRRSQPLQMPAYPFIGRYEFEMTLPENFDVQRRPYEQTLRDAGFTLNQQLAFTGRTARAKIEMRILKDRIEPNQVALFLENLRSANRIASGYFDFDRKDFKNSAGQSNLPFKQATRAELEEAIQTTTAQLKAPHDADFDSGATYCERALAHAYLGQSTEALSDANLAVRQHANVGTTLKCRGTVEFVAGDLAASFADLTQAIKYGQNDFDTLFQRALVAHYLGRYPDADADLARALTATTQTAQRAQAAYWQTLNAVRAKRTPPTLPASGNDWPAPALGLFNNSQSPAQLLQATYSATSGRELDIRLTEVYLYVGQYYLLHGERSKALAYFQQAQDKGALLNLLHHAAARELAQSKTPNGK